MIIAVNCDKTEKFIEKWNKKLKEKHLHQEIWTQTCIKIKCHKFACPKYLVK